MWGVVVVVAWSVGHPLLVWILVYFHLFTKLNIQGMWGLVVVAKFVGHPLLVDFHPTSVCNHPPRCTGGTAICKYTQIQIHRFTNSFHSTCVRNNTARCTGEQTTQP